MFFCSMVYISFFFEFVQNNDSRSLADVKPRIVDESVEKSRIWKLTEINEASQCRSLRLPDNLTAMRVLILCVRIKLLFVLHNLTYDSYFRFLG